MVDLTITKEQFIKLSEADKQKYSAYLARIIMDGDRVECFVSKDGKQFEQVPHRIWRATKTAKGYEFLYTIADWDDVRPYVVIKDPDAIILPKKIRDRLGELFEELETEVNGDTMLQDVLEKMYDYVGASDSEYISKVASRYFGCKSKHTIDRDIKALKAINTKYYSLEAMALNKDIMKLLKSKS